MDSIIKNQNDSIDQAFDLTFCAIDSCDLSNDKKRSLAYSCLIWQCIYYDDMDITPHAVLEKYDCFNEPEPLKLKLYDFIVAVTGLNTCDLTLKASWYINFMYLIMFSDAADDAKYKELTDALCLKDVFVEALKNKYSLYIPATAHELEEQNIAAPVIRWLMPFIDFLYEDSGDGNNNVTDFLRKELAKGNNEQVFARTEFMLNSFPSDEEYMLINVAARAGLFKDRTKYNDLIVSSLPIIDEYIALNTPRKVYFMYYRGLNLLALMRLEEAKQQFSECLKLDNKFMLAELMLKALR